MHLFTSLPLGGNIIGLSHQLRHHLLTKDDGVKLLTDDNSDDDNDDDVLRYKHILAIVEMMMMMTRHAKYYLYISHNISLKGISIYSYIISNLSNY